MTRPIQFNTVEEGGPPNCKVLTEVLGLEEVTSLEYLNLSNCGSMQRFTKSFQYETVGGIGAYKW